MAHQDDRLLVCDRLHIRYDGDDVLRDIDLSIMAGEMIGVIGPNGSGKSTLLRALSGVLAPSAGRVLLAGGDVQRMRPRHRAHLVGVVHQHSTATFAFTVWDVVSMGRHAHLSPLKGLGPDDRQAVEWAMQQTDCVQLADRLVTELSGGELQRVIIARALAQQPQTLLLDEPTNHLDINHQLEIGRLLSALNRERGMTIVWVSHDVNLASEFCERIIMLRRGEILTQGPPGEVITQDWLSKLYGVPIPVLPNMLSGRPQVVLVGKGARA